jgi:diacylglycerol kinase family enzyme
MRIGALVNTASGGCDADAEQTVEAVLREADLGLVKSWCGGGEQVDAGLDEAGVQALDALIVLGGDGTIRAAAKRCVDCGPLLVPLPGGTMNMLPRALYGDRSWQEALRDTLAAPEVQPVSGGRVGRDPFFVAAIIGSPSLWGEAREAMREGELVEAAGHGLQALSKAFGNALRYEFGDRSGEAEAVSLLCPLTSRAMDVDEPTLEAVVLTPKGAVDAFRLGFNVLFSEWRNDASVETARVRRVRVESDEPIPAILDGETVALGRSAIVEFVPAAFAALVPPRGRRPADQARSGTEAR